MLDNSTRAPEFLTVADIIRILRIGRTKALEIMHQFLQNSEAIQVGRVYRVRSAVFYSWLARQDGYGIHRKPLRVIEGGKAKAAGAR